MKNATNQEIRIGGWETKSTPNDLEQIKNFLQTIKQELLNITIVSHSKKKNLSTSKLPPQKPNSLCRPSNLRRNQKV
ncbi:hypothetical Protein pso3_00890 [Candidatus Phytoplasma solani]